MKLLSRVRLLATPWTAAYQAPPPMGFSRQEYWSEVPVPSPEYQVKTSKSLPFLLLKKNTVSLYCPEKIFNNIYSFYGPVVKNPPSTRFKSIIWCQDYPKMHLMGERPCAILSFKTFLSFINRLHSCLENTMGGGAWWAAIHGVAKSRT